MTAFVQYDGNDTIRYACVAPLHCDSRLLWNESNVSADTTNRSALSFSGKDSIKALSFALSLISDMKLLFVMGLCLASPLTLPLLMIDVIFSNSPEACLTNENIISLL
ncbi:hypothetical protein KCU62_g26, partial [Aureobasidium sp. EXF-3399]